MIEEILNNIDLDFDATTTIHLAIFSGPYFDYIVEGKKTIESRFSKNRGLPYQKVKPNDIIIVKQSGGPIVGYFYAGVCLFFDLKKDDIDEVFKKYRKPLCIDDEFIRNKQDSNYATLIKVKKYQRVKPFKINKKGMSTWLILKEGKL